MAIIGKLLIDRMIEDGFVPDDCCRVLIDIDSQGVIKVYTERYLQSEGQQLLFDIVKVGIGNGNL